MSGNGNSDLDPEQQKFFSDRFGETYRGVQWQPGMPSREDRRLQKFGSKARKKARQVSSRKTRGGS